MIAMAMAIISFFLWGRLLLRAARLRAEFFLRVPLMFGLGCFAVAWMLFVFLLGGGRLTQPIAFAVCATPFAAAIGEGFHRLFRGKGAPVFAPPRRRVNAVQVICLLFALCLAATVLRNSQQLPLAGDARQIWGYKAKIIYYESLYSEDFRSATQLHQHPNYPLLVPIIEAYCYALAGGVDDLRVKMLFPVFYICLLMALYAEARRHAGPVLAPVLAAAFAAFYPLTYNMRGLGEGSASSGYADVPLTFFYTTGAILLLRWLSARGGEGRTLFAGGAMLAAAAFTKNEGLPLAALACVAAIFVLLVRRVSRRELIPLLLMCAAVLAVLLPWLIWRAGLPVIDEDYPSRLTFEGIRYGLANHAGAILKYSVDRSTPLRTTGGFKPPDAWSLFWPALAAACSLYIVRCFRGNTAFITVLLGGHTLLYFVILLVVPPSAWDISNLLHFITHRLFMHFSGIALILFALLLSDS